MTDADGFDLPAAAFDLPAEAFPLVVIATRLSDGVEVWRAEVDGPGALRIPALAKDHGPVSVVIEYADGQAYRSRYVGDN